MTKEQSPKGFITPNEKHYESTLSYSSSERGTNSRSRGFTLVEMLVVISLTALVGLGLLRMIVSFYRSNAFLLESTSAVSSASRGLSEALTSLREASYAEDGTYPIASAGGSSITFYADMDRDASVERVRLYSVGGVFYRGVTDAGGNPPSYAGQPESTEIIATWVKNPPDAPVFTYFDEDGTELAGTIDTADIRRVRVRLDVDINPLRAPDILILEGSATLRNLRGD